VKRMVSLDCHPGTHERLLAGSGGGIEGSD
jgi:hypothetical protein